jgi:hypothetical protein
MIVRCTRKCWDSTKCRHYYPGDQDEIDPLAPIAMYFDFPPGTEVYHKLRGNKTTGAKETTRIVPGNIVETNRLKVVESEEAQLLKKLVNIQAEKEKLKVVVAPVKIPTPKNETEITCDVCGIYKGRELQVKAHRRTCSKRAEAAKAEEPKVKASTE